MTMKSIVLAIFDYCISGGASRRGLEYVIDVAVPPWFWRQRSTGFCRNKAVNGCRTCKNRGVVQCVTGKTFVSLTEKSNYFGTKMHFLCKLNKHCKIFCPNTLKLWNWEISSQCAYGTWKFWCMILKKVVFRCKLMKKLHAFGRRALATMK